MAINESWLTLAVKARKVTRCRFGSQLWLLDARGVAYMPIADMLVVSDLHFEKGSYLQSYGSPLPTLDTQATIKRLEKVVSDYSPGVVLSLGDSFHDANSMARMRKADRTRLCRLVRSVAKWMWVEGNHDPHIPVSLPGEACAEYYSHGIAFRHEPEENDERQVIGHFHPKMSAKVSGRRYTGKCFLHTENLMIMPAFGQYTGGLSIDDEVMLSLAPKRKRQCFMLYQNTIGALSSRASA